MRTDQDEFWDWLWEDDEAAQPPPPPRARVEVDASPRPQPSPPASPPAPEEPRRSRPPTPRGSPRRRVEVTAALVVAVAAVAAAVVVPRLSDRSQIEPGGTVPAYGDQRVVAWTVWDEKHGESPFVAILTVGGGKEPVALAIPGNTVATIPGHDQGTVDDAAKSGNIASVAATVENIIGVRIDGGWGIPIVQLGDMVEGLGGITAGFEELDGPGTVAYLRDSPSVERAIRWEEVVAGILAEIRAHPGVLDGIPGTVRPAFSVGDRDVLILPVEDVGAGLASPDDAALADLVEERFVPTGTADRVRLVVLNGNGTPGIGDAVSRLLAPEGFTMVASRNLQTFDQEETSIVASTQAFLDDARRARRLLGVGRVELGTQPTYLADVFVIVGKDFVPDDAGGP